MSVWSWVSVTLSGAGAALAIWAAVVDYRGKRLPMPWIAPLRAARARVLTWIGKRPQEHLVSVRAEGKVTITGEASSFAPTPRTGDPIADRFAALEDDLRVHKMLTDGRFEKVDETIQRNRDDAVTSVDHLRQEITERDAEAKALETKTRSLEVYGLVMVAVGTLIQAIVSL